MKEEIEECELGLNFINKLKPKKYRWKPTTYVENKEVYDEEKKENVIVEEEKTITPVRKHYGMIAQEVKQVLNEMNIDTKDFAGYIDTSIKEPEKPTTYGLNYIQFIAPMIKSIQELSSQVNLLTSQNIELKTKIEVCEAKIEVLESNFS